jgi:hypothetical protein
MGIVHHTIIGPNTSIVSFCTVRGVPTYAHVINSTTGQLCFTRVFIDAVCGSATTQAHSYWRLLLSKGYVVARQTGV